ncbi:MAG: hypothetical protein ACXVZT_12260 [Terriglobales bacterium]
MNSLRFLLCLILLSLCTMTFAQSDAHTSVAKPAPSDAQKSFDKLKTVAGSWVGQLTTFPQEPTVEGKFAQFSLRVTSMGNALVHEISVSGRPDHPLTMFYLDGDRLLLTHYCDAGNRPRMVGKVSPDGKTLEFDFLDLAGPNQYGHMHHAVFTFIDANHHIEEWTWMGPGEKPTRVRFDLQRTNFESGTSGN